MLYSIQSLCYIWQTKRGYNKMWVSELKNAKTYLNIRSQKNSRIKFHTQSIFPVIIEICLPSFTINS